MNLNEFAESVNLNGYGQRGHRRPISRLLESKHHPLEFVNGNAYGQRGHGRPISYLVGREQHHRKPSRTPSFAPETAESATENEYRRLGHQRPIFRQLEFDPQEAPSSVEETSESVEPPGNEKEIEQWGHLKPISPL